ncbi:hypothetical protein [Roseomonas sp. AR75]|jgi:hypothetical protein|uniref:hypothetical protein n=1 Tax=Roseomonas sp. AR75 TaxID=2562311 RepID=UPI0010C0DC17|nr:hypothetical protein [Roseomonas sp. AR75]
MRLIGLAIRWAVPLVGLLALILGAFDAPMRGEPPLGSVFSRAETVVRATGVEPAGVVDGRQRFDAVVDVSWPPGSEATARLRGVVRQDPATSPEQAESLLAPYSPGARVAVRVADGLPWVDRTDWFALLWTVGAVLLGGLLLVVGLQLATANKD